MFFCNFLLSMIYRSLKQYILYENLIKYSYSMLSLEILRYVHGSAKAKIASCANSVILLKEFCIKIFIAIYKPYEYTVTEKLGSRAYVTEKIISKGGQDV